MNASVSGRSTTDRVKTREEKFQLKEPWALPEGTLLQDRVEAANAIIPATETFKRILIEFFIVDKINGPHRCGPSAKVWRQNVNNQKKEK